MIWFWRKYLNFYWNIFSQTPLHLAAYYGYKECCKILLEYGADKSIKNVSYFYFVLIETNREIKTQIERERKEVRDEETWRERERKWETDKYYYDTQNWMCVIFWDFVLWFSILEWGKVIWVFYLIYSFWIFHFYLLWFFCDFTNFYFQFFFVNFY